MNWIFKGERLLLYFYSLITKKITQLLYICFHIAITLAAIEYQIVERHLPDKLCVAQGHFHTTDIQSLLQRNQM